MTHVNEHRDAYIAAALGGLGLVLVLLYVYGSAPTAVVTNPDGSVTAPALSDSPPPFQTAYNYNIAPYQSQPDLPYAKSSLPANNNGSCCDSCGPVTGSTFNNVNTSQFSTLLGTGAG